MDESWRRRAATDDSADLSSSFSFSSAGEGGGNERRGRQRRRGTLTRDELDLLHLAAVRLGLDNLRAVSELLELCGVRIAALGDLCDDAGGVARDGLGEVAIGCVVGVEAEVDVRVLCGEDGGEVDLRGAQSVRHRTTSAPATPRATPAHVDAHVILVFGACTITLLTTHSPPLPCSATST